MKITGQKFEQKNDYGALFKNDKKTKDSQPDFIGNIMEDDKLWRLAAWKKEGKKGTFLSVKRSEWKEQEKQEKKADDLGF